MTYYIGLIELYKRLYDTDAVAYRGTLGTIKKLIRKEYKNIK